MTKSSVDKEMGVYMEKILREFCTSLDIMKINDIERYRNPVKISDVAHKLGERTVSQVPIFQGPPQKTGFISFLHHSGKVNIAKVALQAD